MKFSLNQAQPLDDRIIVTDYYAIQIQEINGKNGKKYKRRRVFQFTLLNAEQPLWNTASNAPGR